jgi:hypothetical protein
MFVIPIGLSRDTLGRKFRGNGEDGGEVLDGIGKRLGRTFDLYIELFGLYVSVLVLHFIAGGANRVLVSSAFHCFAVSCLLLT